MISKRVLKPLTLELIEEGRFLEDADKALTKARAELLAHVSEFGELAKKSKAKITLEISLAPENTTDGSYAIDTSIKISLPGRPTASTLAIANVDQDGEETLFVRASGSSPDEDPRQMKLATDDGRAVDPTTHEAKPRQPKGE